MIIRCMVQKSTAVVAISVLLGCVVSASAQQLIWLGTLGGLRTKPHGVSTDGTVVGYSDNAAGRKRAFRWTATGGMQDLGTLGGDESRAYGVSGDGSLVVGRSINSANYYRAFSWTAATGMWDIDLIEHRWSEAHSVSSAGLVVGMAKDTAFRTRAYIITSQLDLGTLGGNESEAFGVSADGLVVVGWAQVPDTLSDPLSHAFRWTFGARRMQDLGTLGGLWSQARSTSADGSVVVGWAHDSSSRVRAFRWTVTGGLQNIGTPGGDRSVAWGVSADGAIVVGEGRDSLGGAAGFRWTVASGMENLNQTYAHLLTNGSRLKSATAISPDGRFIAGEGYNGSTGAEDAFRLDVGTLSVQTRYPVPIELVLYQNYPNPFNPSTKIRFSIPVGTGHVPSILKVYDVLGREVATLVNENLQPGSYEVTFDGTGLASGVYLYRLRAGKFMQTKRMLLLR